MTDSRGEVYADLFEHAPFGYVTLDADGTVLQANARAGALLGCAPAQLPGRPFVQHLPAATRPRFARWLRQVLRDAGAPSMELPLHEDDGPPRWIGAEIALVRDGTGGAPQCRLAMVDATERVALRDGLAQLAAIVAASPDAIVGRDRHGVVTSWNAAAQRLFGWDAGAVIGRRGDALVPPERRDEDDALLRRLQAGETLAGVETERLRRDGTRVAVSVRLAPLAGDDGAVAGSALFATDISERKNTERALHRRLRQLDLLSQAGHALIMSEAGPERVLRDMFDQVRTAIGCELGLRFRVDDSGERLLLADAVGLGPAERDALAALPLDDTLCGMAARGGAAVLLEELQASTLPQARTLRGMGVRCYAAFPLRVRGRVHGIASFGSTRRERFRDGDAQLVQTVCDQVSAMLERERLLEELHRRELTLREADRAKDEFIATLAHELRNPLAPIVNAVAILRRADVPDPRLGWCRGVIERQVTQMSQLLEGLLDVSRVTRNKIELRPERLPLMRPLEQALEATRPLIETQGLALTLDLRAQDLVVHGDATRLTQVFANLLDNAAKYTDAGGRVGLSARREGGEAVVTVSDSGIGIDAQQLGRVFDMFAQLQPALERSRGGLGIGLALAHGLVALHGGRMSAASDGPGRGSEFVVRLPLADAEDVAGDAPAAPEPAALPRRCRLLVVDDNEDAAQTLAMMLGLHGQEVRTAFDGLSALTMAAAWRPEVAVVDIGMPVLDGYELCRRLRAQPGGEAITLVACTGWGQPEDRERARRAGFDHHLVKPVEAQALLRLLEEPMHPPR